MLGQAAYERSLISLEYNARVVLYLVIGDCLHVLILILSVLLKPRRGAEMPLDSVLEQGASTSHTDLVNQYMEREIKYHQPDYNHLTQCSAGI